MRISRFWLSERGSTALARCIGIGLLLAAVFNGAGLYMKRIGLMDTDAYRAYWSFHCSTLPAQSSVEAAQARCCALATPAQLAQLETTRVTRREAEQAGYLYRNPGMELALKLAKDVFGLALLALSLFLLAKRAAPFPATRHAWLLQLLLVYSAVAFGVSLVLYEPLIALAGARSFMFVALGLVALWLLPHTALLASAVAALLVLQIFLMPFEMLHGVHLHGHFHLFPLAGRLSGSLVAPNTLGAFAVCALAFYYAFAPNRRWIWLLGIVTLALIILSGSGTGMVCIGLFLMVALIERVAPERRRFVVIAGGLTLAAMVMALPELTGRPMVFESLFGAGGRADGLQRALAGRSGLETLFGSGLGVNTNTAELVVGWLGIDSFPKYTKLHPTPDDSMLTSLLSQLGVVGALLFYGTLMWAAVRDHQARMFYAIVATCSLTLQVTELFPVNFLMGIALAHSVSLAARKPVKGAHD